MQCLNCKEEFEGKFCPNCGQKANTTNLSFGTLVTDVVNGFTTIDRGIFFNIYHLTVAPGRMINEYLDGKRKGVFNPISYAILIVSVYLLVESFVDWPSKNADNVEKATYSFGLAIGRNIRDYFKFVWLFSIVPMSLVSRAFFSKRNTVEHMAVHSFSIGHATIAAIIGLFFKVPIVTNVFVLIVMIIVTFSAYRKYEHIAISFASTLFIVIIGAITPVLIAALMVLIQNNG